jgi:hypothetical protein
MTEEGKKYPKKYWWLVLLVLPVILALIPVLPALFKKEDKTGDTQTGKGNIHQAGTGNGTGNVNESVNILNSDLSSKMYVTNVSIIASEYERTHGHPLTDGDLKEQIERAVAEAEAGRHTESIQLLEKLSKNVPLPAIYTSLGVEYAKTGNTDAATKAFSSAIDKDPSYELAHLNRAIVAVSEGKPNEALPDLEKASSINQTKEVLKVAQQELRKESQVSSASPSPPRTRSVSISFEESPAPTLLIESLKDNESAIQAIHVVEGGTKTTGYYTIKYSPKPNSVTLVEPGKYDILFKTEGDGTFVLASNVEVKERTRTRVDPNEILGFIVVDPLTRQGFPEIKHLIVFDAGAAGYRLIRQSSEKFGVPLPIAPGRYDVFATSVAGSEFALMKDVEVKATESRRIHTDGEVAAIMVHDPKVPGLEVQEIYVLRAGSNQIVAQTKSFESAIMVDPTEAYDVALKQPGGIARIKSQITPKRGEITEVP